MEKIIVCKECSSEISASDAFCPYCGIKIDLPAPAAPATEVSDPEFDQTIVGFSVAEAEMESIAAEQKATAESVSIESGPLSVTNRTSPTLEDLDIPIEVGSENIVAEAESLAYRAEDVRENLDEAEKAPESDGVEELSAGYSSYQQVAAEPDRPNTEEVTDNPELTAEPPMPAVLSREFGIPPADAADLPPKAEIFENQDEENPEIQLAGGIDSAFREAPTVENPALSDSETGQDEEPEPPPISISKPLEELPDPHQAASIFDSVRIMEGDEFSLGNDADQIATMIPGVSAPIKEAPQPNKPPVAESGTVAVSSGSKETGAADSGGKRAGKLKPLPEGTILNNRYEIIRKIGGGGMGAVYLASDNNLGGVLRAVKEMVQSHIEEDQQEKAVNDFKRESMILSTLDHPSIPTIYDYFFDAEEGRFYLVMKYISGGDLASKLRSAPEGKIDELTVTEWAIQITDVLNYLHNQPSTIVYRDLKPSNIMLDGNTGRVMLIDFGIARSITQKEEKGVTAVGTMGYAPPELFSGNVEPRSDIYSLGSTMFHLLTGADPQSNPLLIFDFQKNPRPRQINPRLTDQIERILMRAVEYNAESRFSSAAEMKAVLEEHLANLRSGNVTYGTGETPVAVSLANQMVFCGFCGQRIVATDLFCAFCGAKQPLAQKGVHSEIYQQPAVTARLVVEGTSDLSAPVFVLQKDENLIGRRDPVSNIFPEVDLSKYDPQTKISRRHARIWREGTNFMLEDLGSSNGTSIESGGANIFRLPPRQPYKLSAGDRIRIGDARLHFIVG